MVKNISSDSRIAEYSCVVRKAPEGQSGFVAEFLDVPGCFAIGSSRQEAMRGVELALQRWLARASILGIVPPKPGASQGVTGHVRIRTPKSVHRELAKLAADVRLSLNETIVQLLYRAVARDFDQSAVGETWLCSLIGPGRDSTRRPNPARYEADRNYSGTWLQRIPGQLHLQLLSWAQNEKVTINLLLNYVLVREMQHQTTNNIHVSKSKHVA